MIEPQVSAYMATIGRIGGRRMSERKLAALQASARKPRPAARRTDAARMVPNDVLVRKAPNNAQSTVGIDAEHSGLPDVKIGLH